MRDPERLDDFYKKIRKLHQKYVPDWRFGQLIMNFLSETEQGAAAFYWEEDEFYEALKKWLEKNFKKG